MGFSADGKQHLLPEEALYLMECVSARHSPTWPFVAMSALTYTCVQGNLQVFYQDLPFSIQDGYERFLSSTTVSLQQYQVPVKPCSPEA